MLVSRDESHQSAARFVGTLLTLRLADWKRYRRKLDKIIARTFDFGNNQKNFDLPKRWPSRTNADKTERRFLKTWLNRKWTLRFETDLILLTATYQKLDQRKKLDKLDWTRLTKTNDRRWTLILETEHNRPETQRRKPTQPIKTFADRNADWANRDNFTDLTKLAWNFCWWKKRRLRE